MSDDDWSDPESTRNTNFSTTDTIEDVGQQFIPPPTDLEQSSVSEFHCANETDTVVKVPTEASEIPPCAANETSETAVTCTNQNYQCSENIPNSNTSM